MIRLSNGIFIYVPQRGILWYAILALEYHFVFRMSRLHLTMIAPATVYFPIIYTSNRVFPPPHNQLPRTLYPWRTTFTTAWRWGCNFKGQNRHL